METFGILSPLTVSLGVLVLVVALVLLLGLRAPAPSRPTVHPAGEPMPDGPRRSVWTYPAFWVLVAVAFVALSIVLSRYIPGALLLLPMLFLRSMRWRRPPWGGGRTGPGDSGPDPDPDDRDPGR